MKKLPFEKVGKDCQPQTIHFSRAMISFTGVLPSRELTYPIKIHHFDGIYQERWGFSWAMLVSGRVLPWLSKLNALMDWRSVFVRGLEALAVTWFHWIGAELDLVVSSIHQKKKQTHWWFRNPKANHLGFVWNPVKYWVIFTISTG